MKSLIFSVILSFGLLAQASTVICGEMKDVQGVRGPISVIVSKVDGTRYYIESSSDYEEWTSHGIHVCVRAVDIQPTGKVTSGDNSGVATQIRVVDFWADPNPN